MIDNAQLSGGNVDAWCRLRRDDRAFALDRIVAVAPVRVLAHVRVAVVGRRHEGLLDRARRRSSAAGCASEPALSLVPLARAPPNGCCPTTAPVGLSLM